MTKIKNTQDIKKIIMKPKAYTVCDIGGDMYKSELTIVFVPDLYYPDYMEIQRWIQENVDGKRLNIEDVVQVIYKLLIDEYDPVHVEITNSIKGCSTHFDVEVIK